MKVIGPAFFAGANQTESKENETKTIEEQLAKWNFSAVEGQRP